MKLINCWLSACFAIALLITAIANADPLPVNKIGEGIYVHQGVHVDLSEGYHGDICNISFVIGSKGVAVIDTGGSFKTGQPCMKPSEESRHCPYCM